MIYIYFLLALVIMLRVVVVAGKVVVKVADDLVVRVGFVITESEKVFSVRNIFDHCNVHFIDVLKYMCILL